MKAVIAVLCILALLVMVGMRLMKNYPYDSEV